VSLNKYLPTVPKIAQEAIALLVATVAVAWVISKSPTLRRIVREGSIPNPLDGA
jgi:hypothetical protein